MQHELPFTTNSHQKNILFQSLAIRLSIISYKSYWRLLKIRACRHVSKSFSMQEVAALDEKITCVYYDPITIMKHSG